MKTLIVIVFLSVFFNSSTVRSNDAFDLRAILSKNCEEAVSKLPDVVYLSENVQSEALKVRLELCRIGVTEKEVGHAFLEFLRNTNDWEGVYSEVKIELDDKTISTTINRFLLQIIDLELLDIPNLPDPRDSGEWVVSGSNQQGSVKIIDEVTCNTAAARRNATGFCEDVLAEFYDFYNYAQKSVAIFSEAEARKQLTGLSLDWADYLDQTRSQTPLELIINRNLYKGKDKSYFSSPPDSQFIFLHPLLIVENVDNAPDGEQLKESLALELIGVNFWRKPKWYRPSGISLVASYSDRTEVEDLGLGLAVHFNNQYSIGFTSRDEGTGVFITLDFLKLLSDKKAVLEGFSN